MNILIFFFCLKETTRVSTIRNRGQIWQDIGLKVAQTFQMGSIKSPCLTWCSRCCWWTRLYPECQSQLALMLMILGYLTRFMQCNIVQWNIKAWDRLTRLRLTLSYSEYCDSHGMLVTVWNWLQKHVNMSLKQSKNVHRRTKQTHVHAGTSN